MIQTISTDQDRAQKMMWSSEDDVRFVDIWASFQENPSSFSWKNVAAKYNADLPPDKRRRVGSLKAHYRDSELPRMSSDRETWSPEEAGRFVNVWHKCMKDRSTSNWKSVEAAYNADLLPLESRRTIDGLQYIHKKLKLDGIYDYKRWSQKDDALLRGVCEGLQKKPSSSIWENIAAEYNALAPHRQKPITGFKRRCRKLALPSINKRVWSEGEDSILRKICEENLHSGWDTITAKYKEATHDRYKVRTKVSIKHRYYWVLSKKAPPSANDSNLSTSSEGSISSEEVDAANRLLSLRGVV